MNTTEPTLHNYETGDFIRVATTDEFSASVAAAEIDGGAGVITVDGVRCYVSGEAEEAVELPRILPFTETQIIEIDDVWDVINNVYSTHIATGVGEKVGSSTPLELHEYDLGNGNFLQVAFDPDLGGQPIEWQETEGQFDSWIVG